MSTTSTPRTTTTIAKAAVGKPRNIALAAGLLYIATFVFSIPAAFSLYNDVHEGADFLLGDASNTPALWGAFFELITAVTGIGTAVVLYPVAKRYSASGALSFLATRGRNGSPGPPGAPSAPLPAPARRDLPGLLASGASLLHFARRASGSATRGRISSSRAGASRSTKRGGGGGGWAWGVRVTRSCTGVDRPPPARVGNSSPGRRDNAGRGQRTPQAHSPPPPPYRPSVAFAMMLRWISFDPA